MEMDLRRYIKMGFSLIAFACGVGLLVCYFVFAFPSLNLHLNNLVYDNWLRLSAEKPENSNIAVVAIDEASLRKVGQLPWPRIIISDLVDILLRQGVKAIGLDVWLTEPDRTSPVAVDSQLEKNFGLNLDFSKLPTTVLDNDRYLKNTVRNKPVVLGAFASFEGESDIPPLMPDPVAILEMNEKGAARPGEAIQKIKGLVPPLPLLANISPVGLLNVTVEDDGIVRRIPLIAKMGEGFYPSLPLQTLMVANNVKQLKLFGLEDGTSRLILDDLEIPINPDGSFQAVYYGPGKTFPYFSAVDVLDGKVGKKEMEGKIVFIGTSAHTLSNAHSTPFDPNVSDAEIHATIAENILSGHNLQLPGHNAAKQIFVIFCSALAGILIFRFLTLPVYAPSVLTLIGLYFFISWLCFLNGLLFSPIGPSLALILSGLLVLPFRYWHYRSERRKLRKAFSQYVAPEVVSHIVTGGEELLKGQQKEVTILFTDVRGFTSISEKLSPQRLVRLLNSYFTPMTACVTSRHGTLDKFIGDALMAFWNAPLDVERHAYQAVLAAQDMQKELAKLRPEITREFGIDLRMGIGINTGMAHVGNMGSIDLLDYTCIGDNVNLASRLEGMCKRYGVNIVVSSSVKNACDQLVPFLLLDKIRVKGSQKPQRIYTPLDGDDLLPPEIMEMWEEALNDYFGASFAEASKRFAALAKYPFLEKISQVFMERCMDRQGSPAEHWDGVWTYNEK